MHIFKHMLRWRYFYTYNISEKNKNTKSTYPEFRWCSRVRSWHGDEQQEIHKKLILRGV